MKIDKSRWILLGEWFNKNKNSIIAMSIAIIIATVYWNYVNQKYKIPDEISYREYINLLEEGMDEYDEDGKFVKENEDKIDTVYYDLSTEEWRFTLWNEQSRAQYKSWIESGKNPSRFQYEYATADWRRVKVYSTNYDKMKEHIDKYDGIACRSIVKRSFEPLYLKIGSALGSVFLMFAFLLAFFGIYAKKMESMGGLKKNLLVKDTGVKFSDVIGHDEIVDDLKLIVNLMKKSRSIESNEDKTDASAPKAKFNANIPRGMLFSGDAGTGKTMLAKAIAGEAGVPFLYMNASGFVEMYVGVGAKRVRDLFKTARKNSPCIIFIDEIDAVGADRNSSVSSEQKQTINALLQEMDGFDTKAGIFVIAATNNPQSLDKALVRSGRFDRQVIIGPPKDNSTRVDLFKMYLKTEIENKSCTADLEHIAKECVGFTGADINAICNEARLIAIAKDASFIDNNILEEAIDRKIFKSNHVKKKQTEDAKIVAFHEAGHALISVLLGVPVARATIIGTTGGVGGAVFNGELSRRLLTKKDLINQVMVAFGGRAAEETEFGKEVVTTGASNDIQQASQIIKAYITEYGFDNNMVALSVLYEQKLYSEHVTKRAVELSDEIYSKTVDLLKNNKEKLTLLANELLNRETMTGEEIYKLLGVEYE